MTHWDFGKHLEGHRTARAGQARGALALPQCCPMAPKGQHSSRCHLQWHCSILNKSLLWVENWVRKAVRRPSCPWGLRGWAGCAGPCHLIQSSPHASPPPPSCCTRTGRDPSLPLCHPSHQDGSTQFEVQMQAGIPQLL